MIESRLSGYLGHMRQAATDALGYVDGMDKPGFLADKRTQQAVILTLIVLGEAAAKVMCVFRPTSPSDRYRSDTKNDSGDS